MKMETAERTENHGAPYEMIAEWWCVQTNSFGTNRSLESKNGEMGREEMKVGCNFLPNLRMIYSCTFDLFITLFSLQPKLNIEKK